MKPQIIIDKTGTVLATLIPASLNAFVTIQNTLHASGDDVSIRQMQDEAADDFAQTLRDNAEWEKAGG